MKIEDVQTDDRLSESTTTEEGRYERAKAAEWACQALRARPRVSLRFQIYLSSFLAFLFALGIATALVFTMYQMEGKIRFLKFVSDYVIEIEQARRFEKNYFLYGTNLNDALDKVYQAARILDQNEEGLKEILGDKTGGIVRPNLEGYRRLLQDMAALEHQTNGNAYEAKKQQIANELREQGHKLVSLAQDLMRKEEAALSAAIERSRRILIYSLGIMVVSLILNGYLFGSRMLNNINRFSVYAQRIASGDFTPITPIRRFSDEFTDLAVAINQMIQELESREAALIQSHKMRAVGTLTAGVAHELNNPLNNITLTAYVLLEDYDTLSDSERKEMIGDVIRESNRSKSIVNNLLDFARESVAQVEPLDLEKVLKDTIDLAANQVKLSDVKIEFHAAGHLPRVHGDSQQLRQVFLNLILNAVDASPKGGRIQIMVQPADEPDHVSVKVIDFGTGIPDHIMSSIFDPFFTTKAKGKGTGLGLSVSQGIVTKHGGRIQVSSREGSGSTFTVTLPVTTFPVQITA